MNFPSLSASFRKAAFALSAGASLSCAALPAQAHMGEIGDQKPLSEGAVCARNASRDFKTTLPSVEAQRRTINDNKISGAPVLREISKAKFKFNTCTSPQLPAGPVAAAYDDRARTIYVPAAGFDHFKFAHEIFHAHQNRFGDMGLIHGTPQLTTVDNAMGLVLSEATAAAYIYVMAREHSYKSGIYEYFFRGSGIDYAGAAPAFDAAYDNAYTQNAGLPLNQRRTAALEAGGQAVVRALIDTADTTWAKYYLVAAFRSAIYHPSTLLGNEAGYETARGRIFSQLGRVSKNLNLTPPEYTGAHATALIRQKLEIHKFPVEMFLPPDFLLNPPALVTPKLDVTPILPVLPPLPRN